MDMLHRRHNCHVTFTGVQGNLTHTHNDMSSHQTTDNRTCLDEYMASDGESSDDEIEEALLVERKREKLLRQSQFYTCLSTLDE